MKVLQCGYEKSGNYLLWKIIKKCQKLSGYYQSFSIKSGIADITKKIYNCLHMKPFFQEIFEIDEIKANNNRIFFYKPFGENNIFSSFLKSDVDFILQNSSLIFTHTSIDILHKNNILDMFDIKFYILRDGRATINSLIHHVVRNEYLSLYPNHKYTTVREIYNNLELFQKYVKCWKHNVESFLRYKEQFELIKFENLTTYKSDLKKILSIFKIENKLQEFINEFSFENMVINEPSHLRIGNNNDWIKYFTQKHKDIFKDIAGDLLITLKYEKDNNW